MTESSQQPSPLLESLIESLQSLGLEFGSLSEIWRERLFKLSRYSPRLTSFCIANPDYLDSLIERDDLDRRLDKTVLDSRCEALMQTEDDPERALRRFHRAQIVRIALRDLCDLADIQTITEELSDLADVVVKAVFDMLWNRMVDQYGAPYGQETDQPAHLSVIALGKLGGCELNFSSDIDLMFVYDCDGRTQGATEAPLENSVFFMQVAQGICDLLSKSTTDGFLYRVDTRLRPEGDRGALAVPLESIEFYYHNYGQNWERQALLKARPIAGDRTTGRNFMSIITPFTYRKYVDEIEISEVLRGIDAMRNKSLAAIGTPEKQAVNFKNGYGGIRDIEFFVQAVQLLYGGQYPEIKLSGTILSLQRMHESHLLHSSEYDYLLSAYRFLRRVEHRLQMVDERQVYELPGDEEGRIRLAESLDYKTFDDLYVHYDEMTRGVRKIYEGVFQREEWENSVEILVESETYSERIGELLKTYEFDDPKRAFTFSRSLQKSPDLHLQPKTTRLFKAMLPRLLDCLKKSPDSDMALSNFDRLVTGFKARSALYEALGSQPPFMDLLVSLTASSSFLTRLILRDPSLMESMGRAKYLDGTVTPESLQSHLQLFEKAFPDEDRRHHLLREQNAAMFLTGVRFILGITDVELMGKELTHIADMVLERAMQESHEFMAGRYPQFAVLNHDKIAVLGFGKLGGYEFNVASDCDLVFVYTDTTPTDEITAPEYFQRWVTHYNQFLETKTPLGFLYHPDTRLRPHGNSGPLASSIDTFVDYYRRQAQFWEMMALSRARFICGNTKAKVLLDALKEETIYISARTQSEIESVLEMREKIERNKKNETLKAGPGGLVDVEFIAQAIVLNYGAFHPAVRSTTTFEILREAAKENLLSGDDARQSIESYRFLRELENRLRIVNNLSIDSIPTDRDELKKLLKRYALRLDTEKPTPEAFLESISYHTDRVRGIFNRFFDELLKDRV